MTVCKSLTTLTKPFLTLAKPSCDDMDDMEAFEKDKHTVQVPCDGSPKPVVKWTKDGGNIDTKDGHFTITENNGVYMVIIKEVTMDDAGEYQAEFTNRAGEKKVSAALNVHCKYCLCIFVGLSAAVYRKSTRILCRVQNVQASEPCIKVLRDLNFVL